MLFLQDVPLFLVNLVPTDLVGPRVGGNGGWHVARLLVAVPQPAVRQGFFVVLVDRLLKVVLGLLVLLEPEQGCPHVVVVDRVLWLHADGFLVVFDRWLELLQLVQRRTKISVVGGHVRVNFDGLPGQLGLLLHVA